MWGVTCKPNDKRYKYIHAEIRAENIRDSILNDIASCENKVLSVLTPDERRILEMLCVKLCSYKW